MSDLPGNPFLTESLTRPSNFKAHPAAQAALVVAWELRTANLIATRRELAHTNATGIVLPPEDAEALAEIARRLGRE